MGLMRFSTLKALIRERDADGDADRPAGEARPPQFVYVLSEDGSRKTKSAETSFCSHVLLALHSFLAEAFPDKTVATLRGARIFDDMTRLALAPTAIASLSSFSLYPAITNANRAYYPAMPPHKHGLFSNQQVDGWGSFCRCCCCCCLPGVCLLVSAWCLVVYSIHDVVCFDYIL